MKVVDNFYKPRVQQKAIPGYGGKYSVDSQGRVYSNGCEMSVIDGRYVNLCDAGVVQKVYVAYLVARAFVSNMAMRPYVVHKDGNIRNNAAENLAWSETPEARVPSVGATKPRKVKCVTPDGETVEFESVTSAAAQLGVSRAGIVKCIKGEQKTCGGYRWYE